MKAKKPIKAPGKFAKSSGYIAAILFALYAFLYTLMQIISMFVNNYNPFSIDNVLLIVILIVAAVFLLFKKTNLLIIPFALYTLLELSWFAGWIIDMIKYKTTFGFSGIIYSFVSLLNAFGALTVILLVVFSLVKATRKITVVWFLPAISFAISFAATFIIVTIEILGYVFDGHISHYISNVLLFDVPAIIYSILLTAGVVFAGLAVRAYAKQQLFDAQEEAATKDEIIG